jgi:hypothetical protein
MSAFTALVTAATTLLGQFLAGFSASPFFQSVQVNDFTFGFFILILAINKLLRLLRGVRMVAT